MSLENETGAAAKQAPLSNESAILTIPQSVAPEQPFFGPRTPSDFAYLNRMVQRGASDEHIFKLISDPNWRSSLGERQGVLVCKFCLQAIQHNDLFCDECSMPLPNEMEGV